MQRPRAISRLSLVLLILALSAVGGLLDNPWGRPLPVAPHLLRMDPVLTGWILLVVGAFYCATTLVCAFALWRMRPWAPAAYLSFVVSITIYMVAFIYLVRLLHPLWLALLFVVLLVWGLNLGWRIVQGCFIPAANRQWDRPRT